MSFHTVSRIVRQADILLNGFRTEEREGVVEDKIVSSRSVWQIETYIAVGHLVTIPQPIVTMPVPLVYVVYESTFCLHGNNDAMMSSPLPPVAAKCPCNLTLVASAGTSILR